MVAAGGRQRENDAWRIVASRLPEPHLTVVGDGSLAALAAELVELSQGRVAWERLLPAEKVALAIDESWLLVLPSRSEGLGRVLLEAACRGRALVGTSRGGIPDVVGRGSTACSSRRTTRRRWLAH